MTGWYLKAVRYIAANPAIRVAFVSTNSITQEEQVGILWETMLAEGAKIHFGHRTFKWSNEGRGVAGVYCVIVGFGLRDDPTKVIYDYPDIRGEPIAVPASRINPYLADAPNVLVRTRQRPLGDVPEIAFGNMPADGGTLVLKPAEAADLLAREPNAAPFVKPYIGAEEFLHSKNRYCLWLVDIEPNVLRALPLMYARVEKNRGVRAASSRPQLADRPALLAQITQPTSRYLFIPSVSSENREYIPMAFFGPETILSDLAFAMEGATLYHFGVLTSRMHMAWVRAVCGRLESRYRYSKDIVYNNFPWPEATAGQRAQVERLAQAVLDARALFPGSTLADLYDPVAMPPALAKAHHDLDRAVDRLYRAEAFGSDLARVELLFERYGLLTDAFRTKI